MTSIISCEYYLRDYHDDILAHIDGCHFNWQPCHTQLWNDHLTQATEVQALSAAEQRLGTLEDETSKMAFEQDSLKLATDIANIGRLFEAFNKSDRSRHLSTVTHLKAQSPVCARCMCAMLRFRSRSYCQAN